MHNPSFLILDEPFSGLDPVNTELLKEEILNLNRQGTTLMFSTHRMEQVEEICDRIVLISKGENVLENEVSTMKQLWKDDLFHVIFERMIDPISDLIEGIEITNQKENEIWLKTPSLSILNQFITQQVSKNNMLMGMQEILPSLNEIFIKTVSGQRRKNMPEAS